MKTINLNGMMPEMQFSFEGREYTLRCNLCVYEAVSNQCGGDLMTLYDEQKPFDGVLTWLAAMLNDYAEEQNCPDFERTRLTKTADGLDDRLKGSRRNTAAAAAGFIFRHDFCQYYRGHY